MCTLLDVFRFSFVPASSADPLTPACVGCITPRPRIENLNAVANTLGVLNPGGMQRWSGSPVSYMHGIMALQPLDSNELPGPRPVPGEAAPLPALPSPDGFSPPELVGKRQTTTLHFRIARAQNRDGNYVPVVTVKSYWNDPTWSEPHFIFKNYPSGLSFINFPDMTFKTLGAGRQEELRDGLQKSQRRVTPEEHAENMAEYESLVDPLPVKFHWQDGGRFACEAEMRARNVDVDVEANQDFLADHLEAYGYGGEAEDPGLEFDMPAENPITTEYNMTKRSRARKDGTFRATVTNIAIGRFVAFGIKWEGPEDKRQDFYIGLVQQLTFEGDEETVVVKTWNSTKMFGAYKPWNGADGVYTIPKDDVLICREKSQFLTSGRKIRADLHDKIRASLRAWQDNQDFVDSGDEAEDEELVAARELVGGDDSDSDEPLDKTSGVGALRRTTAGRAQPSKDRTTVGKAHASKGKSNKSKRRKK